MRFEGVTSGLGQLKDKLLRKEIQEAARKLQLTYSRAEIDAKKRKVLVSRLKHYGCPGSFFTKKRTQGRMQRFYEALDELSPNDAAMARAIWA